MKSPIFSTNLRQRIETDTHKFLNGLGDFLSASTINSPRAVGDALQAVLEEHFAKLLGDVCAEYSANFARRAMADLAFRDRAGFYYVVDVKTHRTDTKFNMPNLTSVERLARFYEDGMNYFALLLVSYHTVNERVIITSVRFVPIEFLSWDCLTIGALGWGQIQIANSNNIIINEHYLRRRWMLELCDVLLQFYPREIAKIGLRIEHFEKVREFWLSKAD